MSLVKTIMFDKEARVTAVVSTKPTLTGSDMTKMFKLFIHIIYPYRKVLAALFDWTCISTDRCYVRMNQFKVVAPSDPTKLQCYLTQVFHPVLHFILQLPVCSGAELNLWNGSNWR